VTARILGLDIGTTAVKAIALIENGRIAATASVAHDGSRPHPGLAEGSSEV